MIDRIKVLNFLQDFGCAKLEQLQTLFEDEDYNFSNLLYDNMVSKKGDIFIHTTKRINERMLIALDILCKFKPRLINYWLGHIPVCISFITEDNVKYHIIVADDENRDGIIRLVNSVPLPFEMADKLILCFNNREDINNIKCDIPFLYCVYPELSIIHKVDDEDEDEELE